MPFRKRIEPLDPAHQQMTVGRMRHSLGLNRRIHRYAFHCPHAHGLRAQCNSKRFCKQQLELVSADPGAPARHRRTIQHQLVTEELRTAKILEIRIFYPAPAYGLV